MSVTLKVKRSSVASKAPTTTDLELGEIAVNTYDGKVYIKKDNGTASIVEVTGGGGGGASDLNGLSDVTITSPSNNQLLKYDGTGWVNATVASGATNLDELSDVAITSAAKGHILAHNGTQFVNTRTIEADAAATVPLTIKGATSQSGNLLNVQNSSATNLVTVDSNGRATFAGGGWNSTALAVTGSMANNPTFASEGLYVGVDGGYTKMLLTGGNTGLIDFCTTNNNANWRSRLAGAYILTIGTSNAANTARGYPAWFGGYETAFPGLTVTSLATGCKTLVAKAMASQTANVFEAQNSSGNPLFSVTPAGNATIAGDLIVNGTTFTINSTVTTVDDPIITLGGDTAPAVDDNKDRGVEFRWHNGVSAKTGFFGFDDSSGKFTFVPDGTNSSEVYSGTAGGAVFSTLESTVTTGTAPLTVASTTVVSNLNADTVDGYHGSDLLTPAGAIVAYGGASAPSGWLLCDGSAVSRSTYAGLFAVLSTTYGVGDGSTTFNVPNLQQRFPLGKAASGTGATLGGTGGAIDHTHTNYAHYHGMGTGATAAVDISHTHAASSVTGTVGGADGTHTHGIVARTSSTASTAASLMRASSTGTVDNVDTNTTGSGHGHAHSLTATGQTLASTSKSVTGAIGLVTGGVNGNTDQATSANNPPYLVVNFIIKA